MAEGGARLLRLLTAADPVLGSLAIMADSALAERLPAADNKCPA
jgi:hypothetical protein